MAKKYLKNSEGIVRAITSDDLQLEKPLLNENYDIEVFNRNMDKIDDAIQEAKGKIDIINTGVTNIHTNLNNVQTLVNNSQLTKITQNNGGPFSASNGDANNFKGVVGRIYAGDNIANSPLQRQHVWWTIQSYIQIDYGHQIATAWHSDERYIRRCNGGHWSEWREL